MAQKGIAEAMHPWEDQGRASFSTKDGALFVDSLKKKIKPEYGVLLFISFSSVRDS